MSKLVDNHLSKHKSSVHHSGNKKTQVLAGLKKALQQKMMMAQQMQQEGQQGQMPMQGQM
jgi:hypothetical protein